jgi:Poly(ADP-ribose) polymerase catalytic domain
VQRRFNNELVNFTLKYPNKQFTQLVKLLFHGSKNVTSEQIYQSDEGLDSRFSASGYYGQGIYFADNAKYSHDYAKQIDPANKTFEMFLVFVIVGNAVRLPQHDQSLRLPPLLPGEQINRYDAVMNGNGDHTIIYSNTRQYPAFLITY